MSTTNLELLIANEQLKHAERLKRLRAQADKQEKTLLQEITINLNGHHLTAADPLTPEAEEILTALSIPTGH